METKTIYSTYGIKDTYESPQTKLLLVTTKNVLLQNSVVTAQGSNLSSSSTIEGDWDSLFE